MVVVVTCFYVMVRVELSKHYCGVATTLMHRHLHTSLFIRHLLDSPVQFYLIINFIHVHCHTNYTPPSPKTLSLTLKLIKTWGFYCEAAIARQITATDIKALYYIVQ